MLLVNVDCPIHGRHSDIPSRDMICAWFTNRTEGYYSYECPELGTTVFVPMKDWMRQALEFNGVRVQHILMPAEAYERKPDGILSSDYVLDWSNLLNAVNPDLIAFMAQPNNVTMHDLS